MPTVEVIQETVIAEPLLIPAIAELVDNAVVVDVPSQVMEVVVVLSE